MLPRTLFVLEELPRQCVSVRGIVQGSEATMGMVSSCLLLMERLAQRGHELGLLAVMGGSVRDQSFRTFANLDDAKEWLGLGRVIWCSWGRYSTLKMLNEAGYKPVLWMHNNLEPEHPAHVRALEKGLLSGIITVSDRARMTSLHTGAYKRLGRVHNVLNPFFAGEMQGDLQRYRSRRLVFTGQMNKFKGGHRVLEMWLSVRELLPDASLVFAGSTQLYGQGREVGRLGVSMPWFEEKYLEPLARRFGSLQASGIELTGILSPCQLRELYGRSALGIVNLNWDGPTETFCCAGVEMLACELPVFSVARGALPETVGSTGGALLHPNSNLKEAARQVVNLLQTPGRLQEMGEAGSRCVKARYDLDRIADQWERVLAEKSDNLHRTSGPWACHRPPRYWIERLAGYTRCGGAMDATLGVLRKMRNVEEPV